MKPSRLCDDVNLTALISRNSNNNVHDATYSTQEVTQQMMQKKIEVNEDSWMKESFQSAVAHCTYVRQNPFPKTDQKHVLDSLTWMINKKMSSRTGI